jgi:hypothetical protein
VHRQTFILGIGLATGAPDTHIGAHFTGVADREFSTPSRPPDWGFLLFRASCFFRHFRHEIEERFMNNFTYYRFDIRNLWRFSNLRSGQPAASDRSLMGGMTRSPDSPALCRTP